MKKGILTFIFFNVGALMLFFLPTGMLLTDSEDGANWSNFRFLCILHAIPNFIPWLIHRKVKGAFIMFLIFETLMLSYVLLFFLASKYEV
ncbi:hypothetical protein [Neobacillus drentensis]|uniref:hypothetical protein n=1 Tax=Neobacillus drentensis TaxID=220684 RepID=UPI0030035E9F